MGILHPDNTDLRDRVNDILRDAMRDGRLETILKRWDVWNEDQPRLYARLLAGEEVTTKAPGSDAPSLSPSEATQRYLPALVRAAVITLVLSCLSMVLAVIAGVVVAGDRVYRPAAVRLPLGQLEAARSLGFSEMPVLRAVGGLDPVAGGSVVVDGLMLCAGERLRGPARR